MKISSNNAISFETNTQDNETRVATINSNNTMAYWHMVDTLYTNKQKAIVRELTANAYDEHEKFSITRPPQILGPTQLEPSLIIRDFAKGMSHEMVMSQYMTLFSSTKTLDNEQRGGFGLGCKTPFAYTSQFAVESYQNGIVSSYVIYRGQDPNSSSPQEVPLITHMGDFITDEPDGLKVSIPIEEKDFYKFNNEIKQVCWRFNPQPETNVELAKPETVISTEIFCLRRGNTGGRGNAIVGNIAYSLDASALGLPYDSPLYGIVNSPIDIYLSIGEISPTLNREAVSYKPETIKNILTKLSLVQATLRQTVQDKIKTAPTLWEAKLMYKRDIPEDIKSVLSNSPITWNDESVKQQPNVEGISCVRIYGKDPSRVTSPKLHWSRDSYVSLEKTKIFLLPDDLYWSSTEFWRRLKHNGLGSKYSDILLIKGTSTDFQVALDQLGYPPIEMTISAETLPLPPKPPRAPRASSSSSSPRKPPVKFKIYSYGRLTEVDVDLQAGGYYVLTSNNDPQAPENWKHYVGHPETLNNACQRHFGKTLVFVTKAQASKVVNDPNWKQVHHALEAHLTQLLKNPVYSINKQLRGILSQQSTAVDRFVDFFLQSQSLPLKPNKPFGRYLKERNRLKNILTPTENIDILLALLETSIPAPKKPIKTNIEELQDLVLETYPLMSEARSFNASAHWIQYINGVDSL